METALPLWQALALAVLQGVTEFVPVSSSGHLVLARLFFGWTDDGGLFFDTLLHAGSLLAILIYFQREWRRAALGLLRPGQSEPYYRRLPWLLVLATLPVVFTGPWLKPFLEQAHGARNALTAGASMLATALWFRLCDRRSADEGPQRRYGYRDAWLTGCAQVIALLPGASRSGWTTGAGIMLGHRRVEAVRFSFYMAVPAIAGAVILHSVELLRAPASHPPAGTMLAGFVASFLVSLAAIRFCLWFFRTHSFRLFSWYLLALGVLVIVLDRLG